MGAEYAKYRELISAQMKDAPAFDPNKGIPIVYGVDYSYLQPKNGYGVNRPSFVLFWGQPIYLGTGGSHSQPDLGEDE